MKNITTLTLLVFTLCSAAHAAQTQPSLKKESAGLAAYKAEQGRRKNNFEKTKKQFAQVSQRMNLSQKAEAAPKLDLKCALLCEGSKSVAKIESMIGNGLSRISYLKAVAESKIAQTYSYLKLPLAKLGVIRASSAPPTGGGAIYQVRTSSGSRPVVSISADDEILDSDGTISSITWDYGDGTTQTFQWGETDVYGSVDHVYPGPGHYVLKLTMTDDTSDSTTYVTYCDIGDNLLPIPTFTTDKTSGAVPLNVSFNFTGEDPEGHIDSTSFRFGDGQRSNWTSVAHEYAAPGVYNVEFRVYDWELYMARTYAQIYAGVTPPAWGSNPSIVFDASTLSGLYPLSIDFDASKSFDIDGTVASYEWDFGDYRSPLNYETSASPSHTYSAPGSYVGQVIVHDAAGGQSEFYFQVHVQGYPPPESQIVAFQYGNSRNIQFDGEVTSLRTVSGTAFFFWDFGDGEKATDRWVDHTYAANGTYTVGLKVMSITGQTFTTSKSITVTDTQDSPNTDLQIDQRHLDLFQTMNVNGSGSNDPGQSLALTGRIDFGDGTQSNSLSGSHYYDHAGLFTVELLTTNTRGISQSSTRFVAVRSGSTPVAVVTHTPKVGNAPLTVNFDATKSYSTNSTIESYLTNPDGTHVITTPTFTHTFDYAGYYSVDTFVKDAAGNYDFVTSQINAVNPASIPSGNGAPTANLAYTIDGADSYKYHFTGASSTDPNGDYLVYEWKVNGEIAGEDQTFDYKFPTSNIYQVSLTVYDQWGAANTHTQTFDLSSIANQQLAFQFAPIKPIIGQSVTFGAERTVVPGSSLTSYAWTFGDSTSGSGINVTHSYSAAGTYTVALTVTDSSSNHFTTSKSVVVAAANAAPVLKMTARDVDLLTEVTNSGTYRATSFPETIHFSVLATSNSNKYIKDATWTFGDGTTGYGPDVDYTYTLAGTYTVSVTGYDANGLSATASMTVIVPADCKRVQGETECLSITGLTRNVLPFSANTWVVSRTGNYNTATKFRPVNWIYLKALDGSDDVIDLSTAVTVATNQITITKQTLIDRNINFQRPYKLVVNTVDSANAAISSEMPRLYFGAGKIHVTASEDHVRLIISNPSANFKKFVDLGTGTETTLADIPLGPLSIVAQKNGVTESLTAEAKLNQQTEVAVDMSAMIAQRKLAQEQKSVAKPKSIVEAWSAREQWAGGSTPNGVHSLLGWPANIQSLCGEQPPYPVTSDRQISSNFELLWPFTSVAPSAQSASRAIPVVVNTPVRLSCGISSESLMYGHVRWKYKDGPQRCWDNPRAHWYWNWYLQNLKYEDKVVTIRYEVEDSWTGEKFNNVIVTSASAMRQAMGRELTEVTERIGVPSETTQDWAYRQNFDLYVPPHFKRPKISFQLASDNSAAQDDFYAVNCDVISSATSIPKAIQLRALNINSTTDRAARNGQYSLQGRYGYFPVHSDARTTSAASVDVDARKARYEIEIRHYNQTTITWQSVDIEFNYNGTIVTKNYLFDGTAVLDAEQGLYRNTFKIDTLDLSNTIQWQSGQRLIGLKITPKGLTSTSQPVTALPLQKNFVALLDAQTIQANQSIALCPNGFVGTKVTTFAQDALLTALKGASDDAVANRCGNISLPFGGPMDVTGLDRMAERHGLSASVRTLNDSSTTQDSYDATEASVRAADLAAYRTFTAAATTIAANVNETVSGVPTDRKKLLTFCKPTGSAPLFPCDANTVFTDINLDKVLQICQWYSTSGTPISGCPTGYLTQVVRFSKWAKQNANQLMTMQNSALQSQLASGHYFNLTPYQADQQNALVYGTWPDGKQIWDVSTTGLELTNKRILSCHERIDGCQALANSFVNRPTKKDENEIFKGWSL